MTRLVDTREYVSALRELTEEGREVSLLISGSSMSPFLIHARDYIYFRKPDRELRRGDMVFFQRDSGQFVMHRILKVRKDGFYLVGDGQTQVEGPIRRDQIFGLVFCVQRKEKKIRPGDFWWEFFAHAWLDLLPIRPFLSKFYGKLSGAGKRGNKNSISK